MATGTHIQLLEREPELTLIEELLGEGLHGRGSLLVVEGPAGIGKSSLLRAAGDRARADGLAVLQATGRDAEREFAFGGCLQLFERLVADPGRGEGLLVGAADLARPLLEGGTAEDSPGGPDRAFGLLHGLYWLTANLAEEEPLVIAVDDAHWLDDPSLRFLRYLAVRIEELPVTLLVSWRTGEHSSASEHLAALSLEPVCRRVELAPLSHASVAAIVGARLGGAEPEFCEACADLTGGNPLYVSELVGTIRDAGLDGRADEARRVSSLRPHAVAASVLARLAHRGDDAMALARALAVAGDGTGLIRACALASLEPGAAVAAADALVEAGLLAGSEPLTFSHPIVREAVYDDIPAAARARRHADAAILLHDEGADPELVASQLLRSSLIGHRWAVDELRLAARRALGRGAPAATTRYLRRALEERLDPPLRAELLAECGFAARLTGEADALELLDAAVELSSEPLERARMLAASGQGLLEQGRLDAAVAAYDRGLAELDANPDAPPELRAKLWAGREIGARFGSPSASSSPPALKPSGDEPTTAGERSLLAFDAFHRATTIKATCPEIREVALRALGDGRDFIEGDARRTAIFLVFALGICEEYDTVIRMCEKTLLLARRRGSVFAHANASHALATIRHRSGQLSEAVADATAACDAARYGWELYHPSARAMLAEALIDRGELDAAEEALDVPDHRERWGRSAPYFWFVASRARLDLVRGRWQPALDGFHHCDRTTAAFGGRNPAIYPWRSGAALAAMHLGDPDQARELVADELRDARRWGAPRAIGIALRTHGLIEGGDAGIELLSESAAELRRSPSPVEEARTLIDLGAALRRGGRRRDAREPLTRGLDVARRCQAHGLAERAQEELRAAGARPRRLDLTGAEALTPMERRTAGLAADGLSNREVAQSLFLTVRTVEMHLTNAYRKLGISSRRELGGALGR